MSIWSTGTGQPWPTLPAHGKREWQPPGGPAVSAAAALPLPEAAPRLCPLGAGGNRQGSCWVFRAGHHPGDPDWGTQVRHASGDPCWGNVGTQPRGHSSGGSGGSQRRQPCSPAGAPAPLAPLMRLEPTPATHGTPLLPLPQEPAHPVSCILETTPGTQSQEVCLPGQLGAVPVKLVPRPQRAPSAGSQGIIFSRSNGLSLGNKGLPW